VTSEEFSVKNLRMSFSCRDGTNESVASCAGNEVKWLEDRRQYSVTFALKILTNLQ
jgi:hypothetical protein